MIAIVDYGLGNVQAFVDIYRRLNMEVRAARDAAELTGASRIILPGVGAFDWAMSRLNESGMRDMLDRLVLGDKRPVLGVCVGMQMMARGSTEGDLSGLDWIPGRVERFAETVTGPALPIPHMGWNDVHSTSPGGLLQGVVAPRFYFLHSYYFIADNAQDVLATSDYGGEFACAVARQNVHGTQFHPEKSHHWGIQLLKNFAEL